MKKAIALLITISILIGVSGCALGDLVSQAPTAIPTPSRTPKPTFTPLPTDTPTPEATPTATNTPVVVPTDTPTLAPSPTAMPTATDTPIPPPPPPTATPTHTPAPVVHPCSYVLGSRDTSAAGKPAEGTQASTVIEGYVIDGAGNGLNNYGVWFEHPSVGTHCVTTGDPAELWDQWPGYWKHEFWAALGKETTYYLTIKESCAPGAPALSERVDFRYKWWPSGHQFNIKFRCSS